MYFNSKKLISNCVISEKNIFLEMVIFVTVKMILDKDYKLHISRGRKSETEMAHKKK